jgi:hypothetical protein
MDFFLDEEGNVTGGNVSSNGVNKVYSGTVLGGVMEVEANFESGQRNRYWGAFSENAFDIEVKVYEENGYSGNYWHFIGTPDLLEVVGDIDVSNNDKYTEFLQARIEKSRYSIQFASALRRKETKSFTESGTSVLEGSSKQERKQNILDLMKTKIQASKLTNKFNGWKKAMAAGSQKKRKNKSTIASELLVNFVKSDADLQRLEFFVERDTINAEYKTLGLESVAILLTDSDLSPSTRDTLLSSFYGALYKGYMFGTYGAPEELTEKIREQYWHIMKLFVDKINVWDTPLLLNVLNMRIIEGDRVHVLDTGIFDKLIERLHSSELDSANTKQVWLLFSSLMTQCLQPDDEGEFMNKRIQRAQYILTLLINFLDTTLHQGSNEDAVFNILSLVKLGLNSLEEEAAPLAVTTDQLNILLKSLETMPSQNCRIWLSKIIGFILPTQDPKSVSFTYNGRDCLQYIFDIIAAYVIPPSAFFTVPNIIPDSLRSLNYVDATQLSSEMTIIIQKLLKDKKMEGYC